MSKLHIAIASPIDTSRFRNYLGLTNDLPKGMGGTAVNHLILGLLSEGITVSIYTLTPEISEPIITKGELLSIYYGPYRKKARYRIVDLFNREANYIANFAKEDKPDLVHAQWGYEFGYGAIKSGLPHIITLRDAPWKVFQLKRDVYRFARLILHRRVLKSGKNFLVNSPYLNEVFGSTYPVIPNPIINHKIQENTQTSKATRIISVLNGWGNIKNAKKALQAFSLVINNTDLLIEYHFIGIDFGPGEIANQWATKNKMDKNVVFRGAMAHNELMSEIAEATILLHPSKEESFGNVIAEALSVGTPVIGGRDSGAVPWLLGNGERGELVDVNDEQAISEKVISLVTNEDLRRRFSKLGRKFVEDNLTQEAVCVKHLEIYNQILHR